jgi:transcription antitermination factor NusG
MMTMLNEHVANGLANGMPLLAAPDLEASVPNWYAAYTWSRHEKSVAKQLEERRVNSFLPLYRSWHRWKDRRQEVTLPLFPSYVFVHMSLTERLRVLELPGVVALVTFQGKPAVLPAEEIEALRRGLDQEICAEPHPYLKIGQKVRLRGGPLAGTEGILLSKPVSKKDKLRMVISLEVLMRSISVEVDAADVAAA